MTKATSGNANDHDKETKTSTGDRTAEAIPATECEVAGVGIYLDLTLYPELRDRLFIEADCLMLPVAHLIITLIAEGLSQQEES